MLDLVYDHQQHRIKTYHGWLRGAFRIIQPPPARRSMTRPSLTISGLKSQPVLVRRKWTDHEGFQYQLPVTSLPRYGKTEASESVLTGQSLASADFSVEKVFEDILQLSKSEVPEKLHVKRVMGSMFHLWREARTRSAISGYLHRYFKEASSQRKDALKSLLCLCRIYHCVENFVEAAEMSSAFQSIECEAVACQRSNAEAPGPEFSTPLQVADRLGIPVHHDTWSCYLVREAPRFAKLIREKRSKQYLHAEIQALNYHDLHISTDEKKLIHPYVGCSRRCCLLCYSLIDLRGDFRVRGTHETVIHRWNIPKNHAAVGADAALTKARVATVRLLQRVVRILCELLKAPHPVTSGQLLAQSSVALSSAQITVEKGLAPLERSARELE